MSKVRVPQESGAIRITRGGNPPAIYKVSDHVVDVDQAVLAHFPNTVEGSHVLPEARAKSAKEGK